jgi:nitroreductase/NAD-dependent dihydropyrimidine dehydrogenase PreA subunit
MPQISINADVCRKDGLCTMACVRGIFRQEEKSTIPEIVRLEKCIRCGQCLAICPHGAISHSDYPEGTVNPIKTESVPSYDQVMELVRSRRSQRLFKEATVEKDVIEKVLEAARFAPSGHNEQSTEFVVIQDKKMIHEIATLTAGYLGKMAGNFQNPIGRMMMRFFLGRRSAAYVAELAPEMAGLVSLFHEGTDWILHDAPALILFCADSAGGYFMGVNANLALHNASLAAETLGLGCFYAGFVVIACGRDKSIPRLISLPDTHKVYGALAVGYPRLKFKKWPERNPAKVTWL